MTRPVILQFGATGQVARELLIRAEAHGFDVRGLDRQAVDLTDSKAVEAAIAEAPAGTVAVVNAAAYTAVDAAEDDADTAFAVNAAAPGAMARACKSCGLRLVHISTDYVFDGSKPGPYVESDPVAPLGVYGRSKLAGEQAVMEGLPDAVILRTAWVFSSHGRNFLKTMLRLAGERDALSIVDDQRGCPTPAGAIAEAVLAIVETWQSRPDAPGGVYHFAGDAPVSWKEFADAIFARWSAAGHDVPTVSPITTDQYPTPARRPANSVLDSSRIGRDYGIAAADWRAALDCDIRDIASDA